jgi:hypothetical protein
MIHAFLNTTPGNLARVCMLPAMVLLITAGAAVINLLTPKPAPPEPEHLHRLDLAQAQIYTDDAGEVWMRGSCSIEGCSAGLKAHLPRIDRDLVPAATVRLVPTKQVFRPSSSAFARHRDN